MLSPRSDGYALLLHQTLVQPLQVYVLFRHSFRNEDGGLSALSLSMYPALHPAALSEEEKEGAFAQGFIKIYQQMITVLEEIGVKPMDAVGKEFNPDFHNAVMHVEDDSVGEGIVVEEFEKGYTYRDTVIRHSMVKVAN